MTKIYNLKKQALPGLVDTLGIEDTFMQNELYANYLWKNIYENGERFFSKEDMVAKLGPEAMKAEYETWTNAPLVEDAQRPAEILQDTNTQLEGIFSLNFKKKTKRSFMKPFNLKKQAQIPPVANQPPMDDMGLNDIPELVGDGIEERSNVLSISQPPFRKIEEFRKWVDNTDENIVYQAISGPEGDNIKEYMERYYHEQDEGEKGKIAADIFSSPLFLLREEEGIPAIPKHFGEVDKILKKLAQKCTKKEVKSYNLKKMAQHKSIENVIEWGPSQTRKVDPFLREPISDWHIIERNRGFGLVVDDVWNIDYETIWRENIMDKYSRPYKNKNGEWVGGYLNKRFEIDRNIPESNNLQLKPGEKRKPILPEYGNTESRLQAARATGDIEGANNTTEPFNWKTASTKKKS